MIHGMHGYGSIWMIVFWVAFWLVLIGFGIYLLIKFINGDNKNIKSNTNRPLDILQERLAKGEINESEYERLKVIIKRDRE